MPFTPFEALARIAHRVAVSENERNDLTATFLESHGSDEEKKRFYQPSEADKQAADAKAKFDAAVEAELQRRQSEKSNEAAVQAAADKAAADQTTTETPA